jgi:electron transport complex protein RnfC
MLFAGTGRSFRHGVHPPQHKADTRDLPIRQFPFAPVMIVPLQQHLGKPARVIVREGQEVTRGQCVAEADGFLSVSMHAPASGVVQRIGLAPSVKGAMVPAVYIRPHPASSQQTPVAAGCSLEEEPQRIIEAIQQAGIVGLGGAAFPTHVPSCARRRACPGHADRQRRGVRALPDHGSPGDARARTTSLPVSATCCGDGLPSAIIGVEANKLDAVNALRERFPRTCRCASRCSR